MADGQCTCHLSISRGGGSFLVPLMSSSLWHGALRGTHTGAASGPAVGLCTLMSCLNHAPGQEAEPILEVEAGSEMA